MLTLCGTMSAVGEKDQSNAMGIKVGNWWEYGYSQDFDLFFTDSKMSLTGWLKMNVTSVSTTLINGSSQSVFVLTCTGEATGSGTAPNETFTVRDITSGTITRLKSNFNLVTSDMTVKVMETVVHDSELLGRHTAYYNTTVSTTVKFNPALDNYIGDVGTDTFTQSENESEYQASSTFDDGYGDPSTDSGNGTYAIRIRMFESSKQVTVPAGTFDCARLQVTQTIDEEWGDANVSYWHYSDEVGNYVTFTGLAGFGGLPVESEVKLKAYSYEPPKKTTNLLESPILYISVAVIAAVVALLLVVKYARKRRYRSRGY